MFVGFLFWDLLLFVLSAATEDILLISTLGGVTMQPVPLPVVVPVGSFYELKEQRLQLK